MPSVTRTSGPAGGEGGQGTASFTLLSPPWVPHRSANSKRHSVAV